MKKFKFKIRKRYIFLVGGAVLLGVFLFISIDHELSVSHYTFETDKISEPVRIAFIADLHSIFHGEEQEILISLIRRENPDLILFGGDIVDDKPPYAGTVKLLGGIAGEYPCFYVTGNHEISSGGAVSIKNMFREYGVVVLDGKNEAVNVNGQLINICGADDPRVGRTNLEKQLESAFSEIDADLLTVFLFHRPERFERLSGYEFDLMLAGHAHGGQWRIPGFIDGLYSPDQGLFPKYTGGVYTYYTDGGDKRTMIVSRGAAHNSKFIPRINNPPELVIIDIINSPLT